MYAYLDFLTLAFGLLGGVYVIFGMIYFLKADQNTLEKTPAWVGKMDVWVGAFIFCYFALNVLATAKYLEDAPEIDPSKINPGTLLMNQTTYLIILFPILSRWATAPPTVKAPPKKSSSPEEKAHSKQPSIWNVIQKNAGLNNPNWLQVLIFYVIAVLAVAALTQLLNQVGWEELIAHLFGEAEIQQSVQLIKTHPNLSVVATVCFTATVCAPLIEEVIFRGYFLQTLRKYSNKWVAIVWQAALFSVVHQNALGLISLFILGLILGYSYLKTKSLWTPILVHALFNACLLYTSPSPRDA